MIMYKLIITALILVIIAPVYAYAGQVGGKAPLFSLPDLNGRTISLEQFHGKVVFLAFWAPWCIPCKEELPELEKLHQKYGKDGFEVIAISVDSTDKNVATFLKKFPLSVHLLIDKKNEASDAYRVSSLPTGFIISRDGIIVYRHRGFDKGSLQLYEKEINALLSQ
jgi:peroxiredoxin